MKRFLSVILAIMMLLSSVQFAFAAEDAVPADPENEALAEKISEEEALLYENAMEERKISQLMREEREMEREAEGAIDDESTLMAYGSVSGTIYLPDGVYANGGEIVQVRLYQAPVIENGMVLRDFGSYSNGQDVTLYSWDTYASYTVNVWDYDQRILGVRLQSGHKDIINDWMYYKADGTLTKNPYLAEVFDFSSTSYVSGIDLTLTKAEAYVTGTIDLSDVMPTEDSVIWIYPENNDLVGNHSRNSIKINVGSWQTSVDYEIGLMEANYYFAYSSSLFKYSHYGEGGLTTSYQQRESVNVTSDGVVMDITPIPNTSSGGSYGFDYNVTINFSEVATEEQEYYLQLVDAQGNEYSEKWAYHEAGAWSLATTITADTTDADELYLVITKVENEDLVVSYFEPEDKNRLYYSHYYGMVGAFSMASDILNTSYITVNEPSYVSITGDYTASGYLDGNRTGMYIGAQFGEESFTTYVTLGNGSYEILVPDRLSGESFTMFKAVENHTRTEAEQMIDGTYTLNYYGETTGATVDLGTYTRLTGTITLPFAAGSDGAYVELSYRYTVPISEYENVNVSTNYVYMIFNPGEKSANYCLSVPVTEGYKRLNTYITMYEKAKVNDYVGSRVMDDYKCDILFAEEVLMSGTISLPEGMVLDAEQEVGIYISQNNNTQSYWQIIPAGETSIDYSVEISKNISIDSIRIEPYYNDDFIAAYYDGEKFVGNSCKIDNMVPTDDFVLDCTLLTAKQISMNVIVPYGVEYTGTVNVYIQLTNRNTNETIYVDDDIEDYRVPGTYKYTAAVSDTDTSEYALRVNVSCYNNYEGNVIEGYYYWTPTGWSKSSDSERAYVTVNDALPDFTLPLATLTQVTFNVPDGAMLSGYTNYYLNLVDENNQVVDSVDNGLDVDGDFAVNYQVPDMLSGSYKIQYKITSYDLSTIDDNYYYYSINGPVKSSEDATMVSAETIRNGITLDLVSKKCISGSITVNGTYEYIKPFNEFNIVLVDTQGYTHSLRAYVDENMNFKAPIDSYLTGESYNMRYSMYSHHCENTNLLIKDYPLVTDDNGNNLVITTDDDVENLNLTIDAGYSVKGTINLPYDAMIGDEQTIDVSVYLQNKTNATSVYISGLEDISIDNPGIEYIVGIDPETAGDYIVSVTASNNYSSDTSNTNLMLGREYYRVSSYENTTVFKDAVAVDISGDVYGLDITLMTGTGIDVEVVMPTGLYDYANVELYLCNNYGMHVAKSTVALSRESRNTSLIVPYEEIGKEYYLYYRITNSPENLVYDEMIYVSTDGTRSYFIDDVEPFMIGYQKQNVKITLARTSEMPAILESDHPYETGQVYTYEYTYPENADYLEVTFSNASYISYRHSLIFYDDVGNMLNNVGTSFGGSTVIVPATSFVLELDATYASYSEYYGFKILDIKGKNYVMESSHPYSVSNLPESYSYSYYGADELDIYFTQNSYIGYDAILEIYDDNGELVEEYCGSDIGDYEGVVTVPGDYVTLVLKAADGAFEDEGAFGFAITKIEPVYYHTVTFRDYDGTILEEQEVRDGEYAYYKDSYLLRRDYDDEYIYVFAGWDDEMALEYITEDVTVIAQYELVRAYHIVYKNIDGTILEEQRVPEGWDVFYDGKIPVYPYETDVKYSFKGWDKKDGVIATEDMVFTATYLIVYLESEHDYAANINERYEYSVPGALSLDVTFSEDTRTESGCDFIKIYALNNGVETFVGSYSGVQLQNKTVTVYADTVVIYLTSDSSVQYYGFAVTDIKAEFDASSLLCKTTVTKDSKRNRVEVKASVNSYVPGIIVVAAYDAEGSLVGVKKKQITQTDLSIDAVFNVIPDVVKTMVWNSESGLSPWLEVKVTNSAEFVTTATVTGGGSTGGGTAVVTPGVSAN